MAHEHLEGEETSKKIEGVHIELLDDGSYSYRVHMKPEKSENKDNMPMMGGETYSYSYESVEELLDDLEDDLTSPHFKKRKKPKLGSGERFAELKSELARHGNVKNPAAVAASIGIKRYGKKRFFALARAGKK